jgi:uncharacterized lipoprotein YbaY/heat shock protein HslJ/uncharacterized lipoprotein NlpE involved in copper resistance
MSGRHLVRATLFALAAIASAHRSAGAQKIQGTAAWLERITLPAGAVFDATLEDASRTGGASIVLGRAHVERPRSSPIRFEIPFEPSRIVSRNWYVVRARISAGDRLLFATEQSYPVLTWGNGRQVSVLLHRSSGQVPAERGIASRGTTPGGSTPGRGASSGTTSSAAAATGTASGEIESRAGESAGIDTPANGSAVFTGNLPCADCTTVRHQLELFGDESFFLRRTYVGRGQSKVVDDIGTWRLSRDRGTLTLAGSDGAPLTIAIGKPNTLHVLAESGKPVPPRSNVLTLTSRAQPIEPRLRMRGMYRYTADAGRFTECRTRQSWPVAQEGANAALEAAYSRTRRTRGEPLLVELDGRVASRPKTDGDGTERTLVVERFDAVRRGASCDAPGSGEPARGSSDVSSTSPPTSPQMSSEMSSEMLENTDWTLTRVGDRAVTAAAGQREPHFVLHSATGRVSGSAGCNRLLGRYAAEETSLTFTEVSSSRMACPAGMDVERRFLAALRATHTARITRQHLELFDGGGKFLARLETKRAD